MADDLRARLLARLDEWLALAEKAPAAIGVSGTTLYFRTAGPAAWRALRGVVEMHAPWGIYDDCCTCGHDHADDDPGTLIIEDIGTVCEEGRLWTVCRQCHTDDGESRPEHDYSDDDFPCPTLERISKEILPAMSRLVKVVCRECGEVGLVPARYVDLTPVCPKCYGVMLPPRAKEILEEE